MTQTKQLAHEARAIASGVAHPKVVRPRMLLVALAVIYFVCAIPASYSVIVHTKASTDAIEQLLLKYNMKNEGSMALDRYAHEHPFLGFFVSSPARNELNLPSHDEA